MNSNLFRAKKRILITGARAPISLELTRHFHHGGSIVYAADSVKLPITRASRFIEATFVLPSPRDETTLFIKELSRVIQANQIDLLIPTCEEVFFISRHKDELTRLCEVFCDDFEKLKTIHSKWEFAKTAQSCGLSVPQTFYLTSKESLNSLPIPLEEAVFKPEFSRFASFTLISPRKEVIEKLEIRPQNPWVAQRRIYGNEFCSYSIAHNGKLLAHACYSPKYRVGLGSGVYFEPSNHSLIENFVRQWVNKMNFHGQLGFDFIENQDGEVFVLECNPRGTSGAHLFPLGAGLDRAFIQPNDPSSEVWIQANYSAPKMIAPGVLLFAAWNEVRRGNSVQLLRDFFKAKDVCFSWKDLAPFFFQFIGLFEVFWRSFVQGVGIKEAATADIEWNGGELP